MCRTDRQTDTQTTLRVTSVETDRIYIMHVMWPDHGLYGSIQAVAKANSQIEKGKFRPPAEAPKPRTIKLGIY